MLLLCFDIGADRYAIPAAGVREILPLGPAREVPGAPDYVAGVILYRGRVIPVIDLTAMALGRNARRYMSTRIVVVDYRPGRERDVELLGLLAERVTDTVRLEDEQFKPPAVETDDAPFLGRIAAPDGRMIQLIEVEDLLTGPVRELLYPDE